MTNTIFVSQTAGILMANGAAAYVNGVLWFGNGSNHGTGVIVLYEHTGSPAFVGDGYRISPSSGAVDIGVAIPVSDDFDGHSRRAATAAISAPMNWLSQ